MKNFTLCKANILEEQKDLYPFKDGEIFVFLGEISNMEYHCVVVRRSDGKIFSCYHSADFVELSEDEV